MAPGFWSPSGVITLSVSPEIKAGVLRGSREVNSYHCGDRSVFCSLWPQSSDSFKNPVQKRGCVSDLITSCSGPKAHRLTVVVTNLMSAEMLTARTHKLSSVSTTSASIYVQANLKGVRLHTYATVSVLLLSSLQIYICVLREDKQGHKEKTSSICDLHMLPRQTQRPGTVRTVRFCPLFRLMQIFLSACVRTCDHFFKLLYF